MNSFFLKDMNDEEKIRNFMSGLDNDAMSELMYRLDISDEETREKWISVYNSMTR